MNFHEMASTESEWQENFSVIAERNKPGTFKKPKPKKKFNRKEYKKAYSKQYSKDNRKHINEMKRANHKENAERINKRRRERYKEIVLQST